MKNVEREFFQKQIWNIAAPMANDLGLLTLYSLVGVCVCENKINR